MKLSTPVKIPATQEGVNYNSQMMFVGSCFATNVGHRFAAAKFSTQVNPFGVLFNPHSVFDSLLRVIQKRYFIEDDFFLSDGRYLSLSLHSDHSYTDLNQAVQQSNAMLDDLYESIKSLTHLFLTFGTSEVFVYKATGKICTNCHKIPQREFLQTALTIDQILAQGIEFECALRSLNPNVELIYTISPVRYLSEGAFGNSVSKSRLFCALEGLLESDKSYYFPAYEIIMDELRDYRFFDRDMVHPNELAVDVIWERIGETFFDATTNSTLRAVDTVVKNAAHRPMNSHSAQYAKFCRASLERIAELTKVYPQIDFVTEKELFERGL